MPGDTAPVGSTPDGPLGDLRTELLAAMAAHLSAGRPWTMVDFPMHPNSGDSAIWLGEQAIAASLGAPVERVLDRRSYRASAVGSQDVVVIQGGGNWGGLYRTHHQLRLRVLDDLRGRSVVQMPQSIEYADDEARDALRRAVDRHGDVTLLVRDERSHALATRDYDCAVHLVPDAAFALGRLQRRGAPVSDIVRQMRTDKEAPQRPRDDVPSFDWLDPAPFTASALWLTAARGVNALQDRTGHDMIRIGTRQATGRVATANVRRAVGLLSRGRAVVTDRLHGHVLCTLLRIPHVVVEDRFGKVRALWETWTQHDPINRLSRTWDDVPPLLAELQDGTR